MNKCIGVLLLCTFMAWSWLPAQLQFVHEYATTSTDAAAMVRFGEEALGIVAKNSGSRMSVVVLDTLGNRINAFDVASGSAVFAYAGSADHFYYAIRPGAAAPRVLERRHLREMKDGCVVVDIAIDQGGCFETSRPTTHEEPVFVVDGVTHYCVTNMPSAVARTSTEALSNATLPFVRELAGRGCDAACEVNPHLAAGLNIKSGDIVHPAVREAYAAAREFRAVAQDGA